METGELWWIADGDGIGGSVWVGRVWLGWSVVRLNRRTEHGYVWIPEHGDSVIRDEQVLSTADREFLDRWPNPMSAPVSVWKYVLRGNPGFRAWLAGKVREVRKGRY